MQLSGKSIFYRGIVKGGLVDNIQQVGVDCRVKKISLIQGYGFVPRVGKTKVGVVEEVTPNKFGEYILDPGSYDVIFEEGIELPDNATGYFKQRSSLTRNGAFICSSEFDPGFKTQNAGTVLHVQTPIKIAQGAPIAQFICHECEIVENIYQGQYQGK